MKQLKRKLRSNAGASMIFALVFLLFCVFIGGSVLAAATANAGRVASMTTDQQEYLSQRSAALVMADMLTGTEDAPMQLIIKDVTKSVAGGGENGADAVTRTVDFQISSKETKVNNVNVPVKRSNLQRIVFENAVQQIKNGHVSETGITYTYDNFHFTSINEVDYSGAELYQSNADRDFSASLIDGAGQSTGAVDVVFSFSDGYDLKVHFGENSQVYLSMNGYTSVPETVEVKKGDTTTTTTTTIIRWDPPVIEKGGVSDE